MSFLKLLISFAPWIAFLIIARDTLGRVEAGLLVALGLSVVMAVARLHRGIVMWIGLVFFSAATVAVLVFHDMWTLRHLGVLANGALAAGAWATLAVRRPFTLDYARAHTDPSKWNDPLFIRVNVQLTTVWAATFTVNAALAWAQSRQVWPEWVCHTASYAALLGAATFTSWYPTHLRRARSGGPAQP